MSRRPSTVVIGIVIAVVAMLSASAGWHMPSAGGGASGAHHRIANPRLLRQATPAVGPVTVAVHHGDCDDEPAPAFALADPVFAAAAAVPAGAVDAEPVAISQTTLDVPLPALLGADHALRITSAGGAIVQSCGAVGGMLSGDTLTFGLRPGAGSALAGVAVLHREGEQTVVTVYLTSVAPVAGATPVARARQERINIAGFRFAYPELTIEPGTTVFWTNRDPDQHTVRFSDPAIGESPSLDQGETFSYTFDQPGRYPYICGLHPDMTGTVIVK
jgi:plastocyanin